MLQLQPSSTVSILPYMERVVSPPIPVRIGEFYKTPRPHPWRSTLGYEVIEASLPAQSAINLLVDARCTSRQVIKPLKFPNLVTGFDRNPSHAARAALYTRYTPCDWIQNQVRLYHEANTTKDCSENLRKDVVRLIREIDEKVQDGQVESGRKLGERIIDITFWRDELATELERLIVENGKMQECRRSLQNMIQNFEGQLHIAQECLYHRESRKESLIETSFGKLMTIDADLVHDEVENVLLKEVETVRNCQKKLEQFTDKCVDQLTNSRAVQHQLESNIQNKETALGIDTVCHQINNFSRGLQYYSGIEKHNPCVTETESWAEASNGMVKQSQIERTKSCRLRNDIENVINAVGCEMWEAWDITNKVLDRRIAEMLKVKEKLQIHLHKIQPEIFSIEKNLELMRKTITDKSSTLKVAYTRLETRIHRPKSELCKDSAQLRIIKEVEDINKIVHDMNTKLQQFETQHQLLLRTRSKLENDLKTKTDALFIDREKCMGLRRSYPISATVKF